MQSERSLSSWVSSDGSAPDSSILTSLPPESPVRQIPFPPTFYPGEQDTHYLTASQQHIANTSTTKMLAAPDQKGNVADPDPLIKERVEQYRRWLELHAKNDALNDSVQEINKYVQSATKTVKVGEREIATFAPFRPEYSALQTFTRAQVIALCTIGLLVALGFVFFQLKMLTAIISLVTFMYCSSLLLNIFMAVKALRSSPEIHIDDAIVHALKDVDWPIYTILCPLYKEAEVVPQFVKAMQELDYPADKLQILFLTEADDVETRNAIRALSLPPHFKIVTVPDGKPRTKPRACNYGLTMTKGTYVVIYDAEDIPETLQLKKAVLAFASYDGTEVACIQAKLNFYNSNQNLLTRWFTAEYSTWFDLTLPGYQQSGFSLPLGGTSNHFRTSVLRALGGWDAYNVTEDCELGLRLTRYHFKTLVLDSSTYEEANSQLKNWIRQRSRWIKGYLQTYLVYMRHPLMYFRKGLIAEFFSLHESVGSRTGVLFLNPLSWAALVIYLLFPTSVTGVFHTLFPAPVLYVSAFCLIFGNFFYLYTYLLACVKRKQYGLILWTLFIPIYWVLVSVAAMLALYELLVKPHYWQKTKHGLHLKGKHPTSQVVEPQTVSHIDSEMTVKMSAISKVIDEVVDSLSVTASLKAIATLPMSAISHDQKRADRKVHAKVRDMWFFATLITACIASISSCVYFFLNHQLLPYGDVYSHMRIASSIFDSITSGFTQPIGGWLPVPHILMFPFIWSSYLWYSGLVGSFISMTCYIIATIYVYLSARRLTGNNCTSFLATLLFSLNPNILYLQSTPLSELTGILTATMACYYFLSWVQEDKRRYLVLAAASTFLATLSRYDGWVLFLGLLVLVVVINLLKRNSWAQLQGQLIIFGLPGGFGIVLWLILNKLIFSDPRFFARGVLSSRVGFLQSSTLDAYHNVGQAIKMYTLDARYTFGSGLFILAIFAFVLFFVRRRYSLEMIAVLAFIAPFAFYIISLYTGQAIIWVPAAIPAGANAQLFDVRYGSQMVVPAALFLATLFARFYGLSPKRIKGLSHIVFFTIILAQVALIAVNGAIDLQGSLSALLHVR